MTLSIRDCLLDTGQKLFSAQGYAATSIREIADAAGLSLGGIYSHFSSKEDIFQTILLERNFFVTCNLRDLPEMIDRQQVNIVLDELTKQPEFFNLILIELLEFDGTHLPGLFEKVFGAVSPPASWRALLSLMISYHLTQTLLANTPLGMQSQTFPDVWLDTILTGILKPE